jgi:hypothetical protein
LCSFLKTEEQNKILEVFILPRRHQKVELLWPLAASPEPLLEQQQHQHQHRSLSYVVLDRNCVCEVGYVFTECVRTLVSSGTTRTTTTSTLNFLNATFLDRNCVRKVRSLFNECIWLQPVSVSEGAGKQYSFRQAHYSLIHS